ncbi:Trafficking protein particle complex subunit 9 [Thelohanellus kitauei]|uniref:Trafficking protein particle complex subunit 9 n=1 Tax=Thelohanellus kitauei TaxID=669202 RepID=A0A0C2NAY1_THEKT|nr:Trafficking protein particle complex subunit 9 [Thelohanellus kitauei]
MHFQEIGMILIAEIHQDENWMERFDETLSEFNEKRERSKILHSILVIFTDHILELEERDPYILIIHIDEFTDLSTDPRNAFIEIVNEFITFLYILLETKVAEFKSPTPPDVFIKCKIESNFEDELEPKTLRKIMGARHTKILADISLMLGNFARAINLYHIAMETLSSFHDNLWLASCLEGVACACHCSTAADMYSGDLAIQVTVRRTGSTAESELRLKETLIRGTYKHIMDALEYYSHYFTEYPMFVEYHLIAVLLKYCWDGKVGRDEIITVCAFLYPRIRLINNISERILILEHLQNLYQKIGFIRKRATVLYYLSAKIVSYSLNNLYSKAIVYLFETLKILNFDFKKSINFSRGWGKVKLEILITLITIYKLEGKMNEALRLILFLFSHTSDTLTSSLREKFSDILSHECVKTSKPPYQHLPYTRIVNLDTFESEQSGPFLFKVRKSIGAGLDNLKAVGDPIKVEIDVYNPLPFPLVSKITILADSDHISNHRKNIDIPSKTSVNLLITPHFTEPESIKILGYQSSFMGIKSKYILENPFDINCVNAARIINIVPGTFLNAFDVNIKQRNTEFGVDIEISAYEGSWYGIFSPVYPEFWKSNRYPVIPQTKFLIKLTGDFINLKTKQLNYDSLGTFIEMVLGSKNGTSPLEVGECFFELEIFGFCDGSEWAICFPVLLHISVLQHLTIENFSLWPKEDSCSISTAQLKILNLTKDVTTLIFNSEEPKRFILEPSSRKEILIDVKNIPLPDLLKILQLQYGTNFFEGYLLEKLDPKWEVGSLVNQKNINNQITGSVIAKFKVDRRFYVNFISLPHVKIRKPTPH